MATGTVRETVTDWQDVDPGDWQDVAAEKPGLIQSLRQSLEPTPGEGVMSRGLKGTGRGLLNTALMPYDIYQAATAPPNAEEIMSSPLIPGGIAGYRLGVKPTLEGWQRAKENWQQGNYGQAIV